MSCFDCVFHAVHRDMGSSVDVCILREDLVNAINACEHSDSCRFRFPVSYAIGLYRNGLSVTQLIVKK